MIYITPYIQSETTPSNRTTYHIELLAAFSRLCSIYIAINCVRDFAGKIAAHILRINKRRHIFFSPRATKVSLTIAPYIIIYATLYTICFVYKNTILSITDAIALAAPVALLSLTEITLAPASKIKIYFIQPGEGLPEIEREFSYKTTNHAYAVRILGIHTNTLYNPNSDRSYKCTDRNLFGKKNLHTKVF